MKKVFAILLVLALILSSFAMADGWTLSIKKKNGTYTGTKTKLTSNWTSASVTTSGAGSHSMYYQVRKYTGWEATEYHNTKGNASFSLSYMPDGNGNSRGQKNTDYKLRVAHRSQCSCNNGTAKVTVDFTP
ncbi:MAG: hypothetical protein J6T99_00395 [Oscillospiraceae bacterium]|nr:hypothetical protein [Oscillospiraceae bacterium]MBP5168002.1 hypothetical protein [Oscillospiraceae bacterium]MBQ6290141.1 hypothetical protein [Clostridia bacterium]